MAKLKLHRNEIRRARICLAMVYFALLLVAVVGEAGAQRALAEARDRSDLRESAIAYARLLREHPSSLAAVPARRELLRLQAKHPGARWLPQADGPWRGIAERWLGREFRPESIDWLPLLGWLFCGLVLLPVCLIRLRWRKHWAYGALAMAAFATIGTVLIWAWYGFPIGRWAAWLAGGAGPILFGPIPLYIATWALIFATAGMAAAPLRGPRTRWRADQRARPATPTDPRMAIQHLNAQKAENHCTGGEYARRREGILSSI